MLTGGVQDLGRTEQAGRVGVVATGVHPAGDGTGMGPVHLLDGQGVHVRAEGEVPGAGFGPVQVGHDAGGSAVGAPARAVLDAQRGQRVRDISARAGFREGGFRVAVEVSAVATDGFGRPGGGLEDGVLQHVTGSTGRGKSG